jgi:2'-5' RNA ligase
VARRRGRDVPGEPPAPDWSAVGPFAVPSVTLYRSRLSRAGAQYEALASVAVPVG